MGLMRSIIGWVDAKQEEGFEENDSKKAVAKFCLSGFAEGFGDGLLILGAVAWLTGAYHQITGRK